MKSLFLGSIALLGAWLLRPQLQVDHTPVVTTTGATATLPTSDAHSQKPTTNKGGSTMR